MKTSFTLLYAVINIAWLHAQTSIDTLAKEDFFGAWELFEGNSKICENGNSYLFILTESPTYKSYEVNDVGCQSGQIEEFEWDYKGEFLKLVDGWIKVKVISLIGDTLTISFEGKIDKYRRIQFPE